jgi:catechol 2,3-dioxygenase-like lactoylglutathione lyase family enzyme
MIDHITYYATDYEATKKFYDATLTLLGYTITVEMTAHWDPEWPERRMCAYGPGERPVFWVCETKETYTPRHIAFAAADRPSVDTWHAAAVEAGGKDNGAPGERPLYHPGYYGAFAIDPDGNNVEAVCHVPPA